MDERFDFETALPRALTDANLLQFQRVLEEADHSAPDFSPRCRRSRAQLLHDPRAWLRRRTRPLWEKTLRSAACLLLICAAALGSLMAVSPTIRASVLHWVREFTGDRVVYQPMDEKSGIPPSWRPAWLPEGWYLQDILAVGDRIQWMLESEEPVGGVYGHLTCTCCSPGSAGITMGSSWAYTHERVTVQGVPGDYYENEHQMMLFWESPQGHLLSVSMSGTDRALLERVAESMTFYSGTDIRYEMEDLPGENARELQRVENIGAGQFQWFLRSDIVTFQYIVDPPCAMASPDRPWEAVTVHGLPGRYWPCEVPEEETGTGQTQEVDGVQITSGVVYGVDQTALLTWEDPETNTAFQISGVLEREELLRIAESVTAVKLS